LRLNNNNFLGHHRNYFLFKAIKIETTHSKNNDKYYYDYPNKSSEKAPVVSTSVRVVFTIVYEYRANSISIYPCHKTKATPCFIAAVVFVSLLFLFDRDSIGSGVIPEHYCSTSALRQPKAR